MLPLRMQPADNCFLDTIYLHGILFPMFRYCVEHQHLCLMCLKQNYNIAKKCSGDIITVLPGNAKDGTEDIRIRVIEVILNDGTKEYLATNF